MQARFATGGGSLEIEAGMAERQTLPLLPGEVQLAEDEILHAEEDIVHEHLGEHRGDADRGGDR